MLNKSVIIVAAGKGERMKSLLPKQFLHLAGKAVLMHTIEKFFLYDNDIQIIIVLPKEYVDYWQKLCSSSGFGIKHSLVEGGKTRFESVKNALYSVPDANLVAVHDGVRPLVSDETITRCFAQAEISGAAIPVVDCVDSLRQISKTENIAVDREKYKLVQTPQVFSAKILKDAYNQNFTENFTDDAAVVESIDKKISLVAGNRENIKITTETDLKIAEILII
ncbi:MAG: 2-C-methyl-D-erythritol 4-phosphate cytidylyltransferase [Paludibacter sp.]|jgi:2-C-methyl-D-erythritol 4-phosphate cytidylyltransferase|nr:2-C-methyl-D-erythritol 4-phosphate cytidylyltransferase [Paludibacter sp.]